MIETNFTKTSLPFRSRPMFLTTKFDQTFIKTNNFFVIRKLFLLLKFLRHGRESTDSIVNKSAQRRHLTVYNQHHYNLKIIRLQANQHVYFTVIE